MTGSGLRKVPHNLSEKAQVIWGTGRFLAPRSRQNAGTSIAIAPARIPLFKKKKSEFTTLAVEIDK
jgi:hypothetical protein